MSHHTTVVNVTNTTVYINSCNAARKAGGLKPLPSDVSVSKATQAMKTALVGQVKTAWANQYPNVNLNNQEDFGFMYPGSALKADTAPACVVQQITQDAKNWGLPLTTDFATQIAKTITEELSSQGGLMSTAFGSVQVNSNETIDWMAGYAKVNISGDTSGYLYVFAAALEF